MPYWCELSEARTVHFFFSGFSVSLRLHAPLTEALGVECSSDACAKVAALPHVSLTSVVVHAEFGFGQTALCPHGLRATTREDPDNNKSTDQRDGPRDTLVGVDVRHRRLQPSGVIGDHLTLDRERVPLRLFERRDAAVAEHSAWSSSRAADPGHGTRTHAMTTQPVVVDLGALGRLEDRSNDAAVCGGDGSDPPGRRRRR